MDCCGGCVLYAFPVCSVRGVRGTSRSYRASRAVQLRVRIRDQAYCYPVLVCSVGVLTGPLEACGGWVQARARVLGPVQFGRPLPVDVAARVEWQPI